METSNEIFVPPIIRYKQNLYWEHFGSYEWMEIRPTEHDVLKKNIGYAFFGSPSIVDETNDEAMYGEEELQFIDKMLKRILKMKKDHRDTNNIWVSFVCVSCASNGRITEVPVIRVPKFDGTIKPNEDIFIDGNYRVYKNWHDFLKNNLLGNCVMYYPKDGKYFTPDNRLQLEKESSPASKISASTLEILDAVSSGVNYVFDPSKLPSSPVFSAGLCILVVAGGIYTIGRNIAKLHDRRIHMQSIGLDNAESRNCYVGMVGGGMCIAKSGMALSKSFQKNKLSKADQSTSRSETSSNHQGGSKSQNAPKGETHSNDQNGSNSQKSSTNENGSNSRKDFTSENSSKDESSSKGKKDVINSKNLDVIVKSIGKFNEVVNIIQKVVSKKHLTINDTAHVVSHVLFFTNCVISSKMARELVTQAGIQNENILNVVEKMVGGASKGTNLIKNVISVHRYMSPAIIGIIERYEPLEKLWGTWNRKIDVVEEKLNKFLGFKHSSYFAKGKPDFLKIVTTTIICEEKRLRESLYGSPDSNQDNSQNDPSQRNNEDELETGESSYSSAVIETSKKFADREQCKTPGEFINYLRFTCEFIRRECLKEKEHYDKSLRITKKCSPLITIEEFDRDYGIETNRVQYFLDQVMKEFKDGNGFMKLKLAYSGQGTSTEHVPAVRVDSNFSFIAIQNEIGRGPNGWFNTEQYFRIAEQLMEKTANETNVTINEDGGTAIMIIRDSEKLINVTTMKEADGRICGIATILT